MYVRQLVLNVGTHGTRTRIRLASHKAVWSSCFDSCALTKLTNVSERMNSAQELPVVNAVIDGNEIVYRDYVDISVAVATPKVNLLYLPNIII